MSADQSESVAYWLRLILKADEASDTERALATLANMATAELRRPAFDEEEGTDARS